MTLHYIKLRVKTWNFVFLRCRKFIRRRHGSSLSLEKWCHLLLLKWVDENWLFFLIYKSCPVTYKSCQRESKINYYSWFLSRGTSRLIEWIYIKRDTNCSYWKENNYLITGCKPLSWNLCHVRPLSNVEFLMSTEHLFQSKKIIKYGSWFRRRI